MYIIGVYGPSGSGKSALAKKLAEEFGATYVEVDKYWRNIYYSDWFQKVFVPLFKKDENIEKLDDTIDDNNGKIKVKDLKVTPRKAAIMRKLLVQYLNFRINRKLRKTNAKIIIFDHIKFFEFEAFVKSDFNIFVNTPIEVCEKNIMKRDNISENRMQTLVENHVVERVDIYKDVKRDYEISAFKDNYEQKYETLCLMLSLSIQDKMQKDLKALQSSLKEDSAITTNNKQEDLSL